MKHDKGLRGGFSGASAGTEAEEPIRVEGEMTIYCAAACHTRLLSALVDRAGRPTAIDLSRVTEIDTAGLQILLMARRIAAARGGAITLVAPSPPARQLLELCGLQSLMGDADCCERQPFTVAAA